MALVNNGLKVSITSNQLPSGYTKPSVTEFTDQEYERDYVATIAKSAVEDANEVTAFTALVAAINTAIAALITADYDTSGLTVTIWSEFTILATNFTLGNSLYKNTAVNYIATCKVYIKTA